jgi:hypothetical protein
MNMILILRGVGGDFAAVLVIFLIELIAVAVSSIAMRTMSSIAMGERLDGIGAD